MFIIIPLNILCFIVLIILCRVWFVQWSSLFGVLYASLTLIGSSIIRLGKFSSMILLEIVPVSLTLLSSPSNPLSHEFGLCIISQFFWCPVLEILLDLTFSLTGKSISFYLDFNVWDFSSLSYILSVSLTSGILVPGSYTSVSSSPLVPLVFFYTCTLDLFSSFKSIVCVPNISLTHSFMSS